jgi:organic radical activating enzyme
VQLNLDADRVIIPKLEFYITNVCNLACPSCNRFNDFDFKGWQNWDDYAETYSKWATKIKPEQIVILGGEPLLNPSLIKWVTGINAIWDCNVQILTNGYRLNHVSGLYQLFLKNKSEYSAVRNLHTRSNHTMGNWLGVSLHNMAEFDDIDKIIRQFLQGRAEVLIGRDLNPFNADYCYVDNENKIRIPVWIQNEFLPSAITKHPDGSYSVCNNNPIQAHDGCGFATNKNYHFIRGALYKCGPVALMPEFDLQHKLTLSDSDRELLHSYRPLTIDEFDQSGREFLANIDNVIPQCKFCPVAGKSIMIHPVQKSKRPK